MRFTAPGVAQVNGKTVRLLGKPTCTCPWWIDYRGSRGPCKHVLAAQKVAAQVEVPA